MSFASKLYDSNLCPNWILQILSDILIFLSQNSPHPKLRIFFCKLRGAKLIKVQYIGMNCLIGNHPWLLTIKENAVISSGTRILTEDHSYKNLGGRKIQKEVIIEENVHIGMNCIILPGVTIGKNSIIGANSMVTKSVPDNSVATGNPARVFMTVDQGLQMLNKQLQ